VEIKVELESRDSSKKRTKEETHYINEIEEELGVRS
jgi:hypothetical protein